MKYTVKKFLFLFFKTSIYLRFFDTLANNLYQGFIGKKKYRSFLYRLLQQYIHYNFSKLDQRYTYSINSPESLKEYILDVVSTETIARTAEIFGFCHESIINFYPVDINVFKFQNAICCFGSDIIRLENTCYWYKYNSIMHQKLIPSDKDFIAEKNGRLFLLPLGIENIISIDKAISLLGATDGSWSHFVVQYLPKLELFKKYIKNEHIVVLISEKIDANCEELILMLMETNWTIHKVKLGEFVECKELYYADNTSWLTDHSSSTMLGDTRLYTYALNVLNSLVVDLKKKYPVVGGAKKRIYLRRVGNRGLINTDELDTVLEGLGFDIVYGHEFTLQEKVEIFSNAEIIVGIASSGFVNTIFCDRNTKIVAILGLNRIFDTYLSALNQPIYFPSVGMRDYTDPHTSFKIDILKFEKLILDLLNGCKA